MKIVIQAGHQNVKSNSLVALRTSTGAPGELELNVRIANRLSSLMRERGFEVVQTDANANDDPSITSKDWDLFLALHGDADYSGDGGSGFATFPEPSTDDATAESQRIAKVINDTYFPEVQIVYRDVSNDNTKFYYMWRFLSKLTPCVLIEMGQVQDPHDRVLLANTDLIANALGRSICKAFNVPFDLEPSNPPTDTTDYKSLYEKVINESQTKMVEQAQLYEKEKAILTTQISTLETALKTLQDTEHTWEDQADDYQRKLKAIVDIFTSVNVQLAVESDVSVLVGTLHDYIANAEADRTFVQRILIDTSLGSIEAVLDALQQSKLNETTITELEKQITKLNTTITTLKNKQPSLWQFIINKYFTK